MKKKLLSLFYGLTTNAVPESATIRSFYISHDHYTPTGFVVPDSNMLGPRERDSATPSYERQIGE